MESLRGLGVQTPWNRQTLRPGVLPLGPSQSKTRTLVAIKKLAREQAGAGASVDKLIEVADKIAADGSGSKKGKKFLTPFFTAEHFADAPRKPVVTKPATRGKAKAKGSNGDETIKLIEAIKEVREQHGQDFVNRLVAAVG